MYLECSQPLLSLEKYNLPIVPGLNTKYEGNITDANAQYSRVTSYN